MSQTKVTDAVRDVTVVDGTKIDVVDGAKITTGTVDVARLPSTAVNSNVDLTTLSASNLTSGTLPDGRFPATLPAISGASLTGITAGPTISASDPAIDTNATLGTQWANSTSGEFYVMTDATTGQNVWTNVGDGTGTIEPWVFQGGTNGYLMGGGNATGGNTAIHRISFASATTSGVLLGATMFQSTEDGVASGRSENYGYDLGGQTGTDTMQKFNMVTEASGTDVGNLHIAKFGGGGASSRTAAAVYHQGGYNGSSFYRQIDKCATASDGDSTDQGDITETAVNQSTGCSSTTHGYNVGGASLVTIDKFQFSSSTGSSDVGDLAASKWQGAGCSSSTNGYAAGGANPSPHSYVADIQKFSFSSGTQNSSSVGNLTVTRRGNGVQPSSTTHGYCIGGYAWGPGNTNVMDRWPFASDSGATDVGDLNSTSTGGAGCQY